MAASIAFTPPSFHVHELSILAGLLLQQWTSRTSEVKILSLFTSYTLLALTCTVYLALFAHPSIPLTVLHILFLTSATFATLTLLRRLFFHPLRSFPGPILARVSKLHQAYYIWRGQYGLYLKSLHEQYGEIVRTAPNEVSVQNVDVLEKVWGRRAPATRGPFWKIAVFNGGENVISARDRRRHSELRKLWDRAFSAAAVGGYVQRTQVQIEKFMEVLNHSAGREVDAIPLVDRLMFDIMADTSFGTSAGQQDGSGDRGMLDAMHAFSGILYLGGCFLQYLELVPHLPDLPAVTRFKEKCMGLLTARMSLGTTRNDVFTQFLSSPEDAKLPQDEIMSSTILVIVAGADTTSTAFAAALRALARHPDVQEKLWGAVDAAIPGGVEITPENVKGIEYLDAVINETLRLWNPVPGGTQMILGSESVEVAGRVLPAYAEVRYPALGLMADERYFVEGNRWIPERWGEREGELVKDKRAFVPFSYGRHQCVGRVLAMQELRLSLVNVVRAFRVELGESYDDRKFRGRWTDVFTVLMGDLPLKFVKRGEAEKME